METNFLCFCALSLLQTSKGIVPASTAPAELPVGRLQLMEVVDMLLDIGRTRAVEQGPESLAVADVHFAAALALIQLEEPERAEEQLTAATELLGAGEGGEPHQRDPQRAKLLDMARIMVTSI